MSKKITNAVANLVTCVPAEYDASGEIKNREAVEAALAAIPHAKEGAKRLEAVAPGTKVKPIRAGTKRHTIVSLMLKGAYDDDFNAYRSGGA